MARTNLSSARVKPEVSELLMPHVVRSERISPSFARVTLGGGDLMRFRAMGFDQWFRLFIPVARDSLSRLPNKLDEAAYQRFLAISETRRPILRNYTIRSYRPDGPDGPEIDVDFVLHGSPADGTSGPAAVWAQSCKPGDVVALLDEGVGFNPAPDLRRVLLVADESGLPAVAGVLASLPRDFGGRAIIELPAEGDRQQLDAPDGVEVTWVLRTDPEDVPGRAALRVAVDDEVPDSTYGWVVGEQALPTTLRRHWVRGGMPKANIMFCGYWRRSQHTSGSASVEQATA